MESSGDETAEPQKEEAAVETLDLPEVEDEAAAETHDLPEEGEAAGRPFELLEGHKHERLFRWLYRLHDTTESCLEPMRLTEPNELCYPRWTACRRHGGCAMLQIFSLKLTNPPPAVDAGEPIAIFGFMAVRDLSDSLRNYVFNRSRDDPFVIKDVNSDPFIQLSGPARGVNLQARAMLEYDMKVVRNGQGEEADDVPLIAGTAVFSNKATGAFTHRITGDHGAAAVEMRRARFPRAAEATVQVTIIEFAKRDGNNGNGDGGLDLSITGFVPTFPGEDIMLFRGVVDHAPCELRRFVVAVATDSYLILRVEARDECDDDADAGSSSSRARRVGKFAFRATVHGR